MDVPRSVFNWFRHFGVAFMAAGVLSSVIIITYQYLAMMADSFFHWHWPFVFMRFSHDASGFPTGSLDWRTPVLPIVALADLLIAFWWATSKKNDFSTYLGYRSKARRRQTTT